MSSTSRLKETMTGGFLLIVTIELPTQRIVTYPVILLMSLADRLHSVLTSIRLGLVAEIRQPKNSFFSARVQCASDDLIGHCSVH